ncbi:TssQ family T6SS-associated lipoprotein [Cellvibrio sp. pealriver]|uniref:TssQ family T6SS-associated lipoprotein n=1 Tax=Cellvibrio sp. pealriver TaxID=1622269 RepID=UPI00069CC277|nr:TssQ family T6SS-associated lipoprotein [Cellvibrio sp. pealriver]
MSNTIFLIFLYRKFSLAVVITLSFCVFTGCSTTQTKPTQASPAQIKLEIGKNNFQNGEYGIAETNLLDSAIWQGDKSEQVESLKYLAFIYCVTERITLCRHSFYKALQLNPEFELTPAESTHPLWGPEFIVAQSGLGKQ